jgi:tight adherence protein B
MKRVVALLGALLAVVAFAATPASATDSLVVRKVDTNAFPTIRILLGATGEAPDRTSFTVRENGRVLDGVTIAPIGTTQLRVGTVLAIDTSESMNQNNAIDQARAAAKQFIANKKPNDVIAIVAFNDGPDTVVDFTSDAGVLNAGVDKLVGRGETALYDGIRQSVALFNDFGADLVPNIVVLSDGRDTVSTSSFDQAKGSVKSIGAAFFGVGLQGADFDAGPLRNLASSTGGEFLETADPPALTAAYDRVQQAIQNQYEVSYASTSDAATLDLTISAGGATVAVAGIPTNAQGVVTPPKFVQPSDAPSFLTSSWSKYLIAALALAAVAILAYGVFLIFVRDRSVERALQPYAEGAAYGGAGDEDGTGSPLLESAFMQRAVEATARIARERGVLERVEGMLERADLPIQASEALFLYVVSVVILSALALVAGTIFLFLVVALLTAVIPPATLAFMAGQRQRKFTGQLPDTLQLLAGTLRAGYSLLQGVEAVAQEVEDPMGRELRRVLAEARLGRPLEEALDDAAKRMSSGDFEWAVMAIKIQREVGGNRTLAAAAASWRRSTRRT